MSPKESLSQSGPVFLENVGWTPENRGSLRLTTEGRRRVTEVWGGIKEKLGSEAGLEEYRREIKETCARDNSEFGKVMKKRLIERARYRERAREAERILTSNSPWVDVLERVGVDNKKKTQAAGHILALRESIARRVDDVRGEDEEVKRMWKVVAERKLAQLVEGELGMWSEGTTVKDAVIRSMGFDKENELVDACRDEAGRLVSGIKKIDAKSVKNVLPRLRGAVYPVALGIIAGVTLYSMLTGGGAVASNVDDYSYLEAQAGQKGRPALVITDLSKKMASEVGDVKAVAYKVVPKVSVRVGVEMSNPSDWVNFEGISFRGREEVTMVVPEETAKTGGAGGEFSVPFIPLPQTESGRFTPDDVRQFDRLWSDEGRRSALVMRTDLPDVVWIRAHSYYYDVDNDGKFEPLPVNFAQVIGAEEMVGKKVGWVGNDGKVRWFVAVAAENVPREKLSEKTNPDAFGLAEGGFKVRTDKIGISEEMRGILKQGNILILETCEGKMEQDPLIGHKFPLRLLVAFKEVVEWQTPGVEWNEGGGK